MNKKISKRYFPKLLLFLFSAGLLLLISSCSEKSNAPEPPHLKAQLVSELFSALRQENYEMASNRINRLRELDPEDVSLQTIQINIQNNLVMQRAQADLNKGDIDAAIKTIDDFSAKNGQTANLRDAVRELMVLKDIKISINNILSEYNQISASSKSTSNGSIPLIPKTITQEDALGLENLKADIDTSWVRGNPDIDTLIAILEVENPSDSLVSFYRKSMSQDWEKTDISANYLNTNAEVLIFRILANTSFSPENKSSIKKIASFAPNNFKDMLAKAIMLNFTGDVEKSNAMLNAMQKILNANDSVYKSWFTLTPQNKSLDKLNSFIIYPFFIYCNQNAIISAQQINK